MINVKDLTDRELLLLQGLTGLLHYEVDDEGLFDLLDYERKSRKLQYLDLQAEPSSLSLTVKP